MIKYNSKGQGELEGATSFSTEPTKQGRSLKRAAYLTAIEDENVVAVMDFLSNHKPDDGYQALYINSYGGDVPAAYALFQFLMKYELPLEVRIFGTCMSAAVLFVAAKDNAKVDLHIDPGTHFMIHAITYYMQGSSKDLKQHLPHMLVWYEKVFEVHYSRALDILGVSSELRERAKTEDVHFIY